MKRTNKQRSEEHFHDHYASTLNVDGIAVSKNPSAGYQELRRAQMIFGPLRGKKILDLGCGCGETAVFWAKLGARVYAIDISGGMVTLAKRLARKYKVSKNCQVEQMAAEKLTFKNNSFDYIFGDGILHHVDMEKAISEVHRVLKTGGIAAFIEPITYNPAINMYRKVANHVRTPMEEPLTFGDIEKIRTVFPNVKHEEYHFLTLLIFVLFYLTGVNPNKERYWKKFRHLKGSLRHILVILAFLDRVMLKIFPPVRYLCWNTLIILQK